MEKLKGIYVVVFEPVEGCQPKSLRNSPKCLVNHKKPPLRIIYKKEANRTTLDAEMRDPKLPSHYCPFRAFHFLPAESYYPLCAPITSYHDKVQRHLIYIDKKAEKGTLTVSLKYGTEYELGYSHSAE